MRMTAGVLLANERAAGSGGAVGCRRYRIFKGEMSGNGGGNGA